MDCSPGVAAVAMRGLVHSHLVSLGLAVEEPVPDDRYHAIYFAMLLAGVGFLLPYNSFITDVDFLHHKYPGGSPESRLPTPAALWKPHGQDPAGEPVLFKSWLGSELLSDRRAAAHPLWAVSPSWAERGGSA